MQPAEPREFGVLQPRNGAEHRHLLGMLQLRLEAHHVVERAQRIILAQLDDGAGLDHGIARVRQPDGFHRTVPQSFPTTFRHHLDRQAAVEIGRALPFVEGGLLAGQQCIDERLVLDAVERAVDVVAAIPSGPDLVVAGLEPGLLEIDGVTVDDGRDGVEKRQLILAGQRRDSLRQPRRGQRPGGHDDFVPFGRR